MQKENAIEILSITKKFNKTNKIALNNITTGIPKGKITGLIGPDGSGKTTLMRMIAGILKPTSGQIKINIKVDENKSISSNISYMPQKFGLYEDLSVLENLKLYANLQGVRGDLLQQKIKTLLEFTNLAPFTSRLAGNLSGGMKQKLGLACSLIHNPEILLLDEPSVGVDPLSRRELWKIIYDLIKSENVTIVWSTSYLDEAEKCSHIIALNDGNILYEGSPKELTNSISGRTFLVDLADKTKIRKFATEIIKNDQIIDSVIQGKSIRIITSKDFNPQSINIENSKLIQTAPRFEDAFMILLGGISKDKVKEIEDSTKSYMNLNVKEDIPIIEVDKLTKEFNGFRAVDQISFKVKPGEIFGLLGPNGAGKSTTFKMMCGLLKPTSGFAKLAGIDLIKAPAKVRQMLGYMAQKFSLYGDLNVIQNLEFYGGVYGLKSNELKNAVFETLERFELIPYKHEKAIDLPLGIKQRLSMACATIHNPQILFLDEPTSGVDPITRREFWFRINAFVEKKVAVVVTTHFMDEAEYCDNIVLIFQGKIIARGGVDDIWQLVKSQKNPNPTLEDAFVELVEAFYKEKDYEKISKTP
ncbi:ATP-binding cassette domain-containing protein [Desulfurella sp.]|uniref:ATP-binding cassette domain-containing protein n=1 Tax=Desulfurella sp. TaxID=1962857 RepID=UPI003D0FDB1E